MSLSSGEILNNRYRIVRQLGEGGFGAVYRAWDTNLGEPVAIKESLHTSPAAQKQFQLEAKLLFRLVHPNLPRVHDYFVIPNQGTYLVMDFIEGEDLCAKLDHAGGALPEGDVLPWIGQICNALIYLHSRTPLVVHRDIKPANIRITPEGVAMLVDLGIAKVFEPGGRTMEGAQAYSPGYSPVEQYSGEGTDPRSDVYALGATLYHLLTGQQPPESVKIAGGTATLCLPRQLNARLSQEIEELILKSMEIAAKNRYQNMEDLRVDLQHSLLAPPIVLVEKPISQALPYEASQPSQARIPTLPWRWLGLVGGLGFLVVILVAIVIGMALGGGKETPAPVTVTGIAAENPQVTSLTTLETTQAPPLSTTEIPPKSTTEATPTFTPLPVDFTDDYGVKMKFIPASEFQMGSESGSSDESPVHTVYLDAFYIDIYEVTNLLYALCVEAGACTEPHSEGSYNRDSYYGNSTYDEYPVIYVDWDQANGYCEWRDARLPTEAEWEKAARGGLEGKLYPWGDQAPDCSTVNYSGTNGCEGDTTRVGSYAPNGFGLFDMAGNVWEWVMDWYGENYYGSSSSRNPSGPSSGTYRVLRGGSWLNVATLIRVALRNWYSPYDRLNWGSGNGFRCAR